MRPQLAGRTLVRSDVQRRFARAALSLVFGLVAGTADAGPTFVVNSLADVPAGPNTTDAICETATGNGVCTLRAAIGEANNVPDSTVRLPAGFYPLTLGTLFVLAPMQIEGDGPSVSVVDGINLGRVFNVFQPPSAPRVEIRGITIQRGAGTGGGIRAASPLLLENVHVGQSTGAFAAGVLVESSVSIRHCVIEGNVASSTFGGGLYVSSAGTVSIEDSRIERNFSTRSGGGIFASPGSSLRIERSSISRNIAGASTALSDTGGGIELQGNALIMNSLVWLNASAGPGGGLNAASGSTQLINSTITNNAGFASFASSPPGGAIQVVAGAGLSLTRSIATSNKSECLGSIFSGDYNIVRSASDCPLFGLLTHNLFETGFTVATFNGGFAPDVSSFSTTAAVAVPAASCLDDLGAPLTTDFRGHRRQAQYASCDIGAHDTSAIYTPEAALDVNLVRNGGSTGQELGLAATIANPTRVDFYQAPYWAQVGRMVQLVYGAPDGYPGLADAPAGSGHKFFAGGVDPVTNAYQTLDLSGFASQIDAGGLAYTISGAFGGYLTDEDRASLFVAISDESGAQVDEFLLGGFSAADRGNQTRLIADQRAGILPVGTRYINLALSFERFAGFANDGYADGISVVLPEPGSAASLGAGWIGLATLARRRRSRASTAADPRSAGPRTGKRLAALALRAIVASIATLPTSASADDFYCIIHGTPFGPGIWLCAGTDTTGAIGWSPGVESPDGAGPFPVEAASAGSNGGDFAASASATASAYPGVLSLQTSAGAFGTGLARSRGGAIASFQEVGTLSPIGGASPGAPVAARLTIDVSGAFANTGASADGVATVYRGSQLLVLRSLFLSTFGNAMFLQIDVPGVAVGDALTLFLRMSVSSGAADTGPTGSSANLTNSAKLQLDVLSSNAVFVSTSGHDYRTVPEPEASSLVGLGVLTIATLAIATRGRLRGGSDHDSGRCR